MKYPKVIQGKTQMGETKLHTKADPIKENQIAYKALKQTQKREGYTRGDQGEE